MASGPKALLEDKAVRLTSHLVEATVTGLTVGVTEFLAAQALHRFADLQLRQGLLYSIPVATVTGGIVFLVLLRKREKSEPNIEPTPAPEPSLGDETTKVMESCLPVFREMGIMGCTTRLSSSQYEPSQCMKRARKKLYFMGILASKWVIEPHVRSEFRQFLSRIQLAGGDVRFLLIDPGGHSFKHLKTHREGAISTESLKHVRTLTKDFACFKVRLYDQLPCFRLVFLDENILAVSRYKIRRDGYFESKFGWEAPHLVVQAGTAWSFYDAFDLYFNQIWDASREIAGN